MDALLASLCVNHQNQMPPALRSAIMDTLKDKQNVGRVDPPAPPKPDNPFTVHLVCAERMPSSKRILLEVSAKHQLSVKSIKSNHRGLAFVYARHEVCFRLRHELGYSYPRIGRFFGGMDHTTCLNAVRRHAERIAEQTGAE